MMYSLNSIRAAGQGRRRAQNRLRDVVGHGDGVAVTLAGALGVPLLATEKAFREAKDFAAIGFIR